MCIAAKMKMNYSILCFLILLNVCSVKAQNIYTIAGNGIGNYSGNGGAATAAELWIPAGLVFDTAGNLYISDGQDQHIRKVNKTGIISSVAGGGSSLGDGGPATAAGLGDPEGLAIDKQGNLYIADAGYSRIRRI